MEVLRDIQRFLKNRFLGVKFENVYIEFVDFFASEKLFGLFGLNNLPGSQTEGIPKLSLFFRKFALGNILITLILLLTSLIFGSLGNPSVMMVAENFCATTITFVTFFKLYIIKSFHGEKLREIIETLDRHYPHNGWDQHVFKVSNDLRTLKIIRIITLVFNFSGSAVFNLAPLLANLIGFVDSQDIQLGSILQLYLPVDQKNPVIYAVISLISIGFCVFCMLFALMTYLLYAELVALLSMELRNLGQMMSEIDPQEQSEDAYKRMKKLIKAHQELINVAEQLEEIFSPILLIDIFGILSMMCVSAFLTFSKVAVIIFIKYIFLFLAATQYAFIHCFYADRLCDASLSISDGAYSSSWVYADIKYRKMILTVMRKSQKPQKLTGMNLVTINLETFRWVIETTYSYYSILVALYDST